MCGLFQMYAYVAIVNGYDVKKDGLKKISQRKVIQKSEKGRAILL